MRLVKPGVVWLEKGETAPVLCACGWVYTPRPGSDRSLCPLCGRDHDHGAEALRAVEE
jgi:hypothetical protein